MPKSVVGQFKLTHYQLVHGIDDFSAFIKNPPPWLKELEGGFKNPPAWMKSIETTLGPTATTVAGLAALAVAVGAGSAIVTGMAGLAAALVLSPFRLGAGAVGVAAGATGSLASKVLPVAGAVGLGIGLGELLDQIPGIGDMFKAIGQGTTNAIMSAIEDYKARAHPAAPWQDSATGIIPAAPSGVGITHYPAPPTPNATRPNAPAAGATHPTGMNGNNGSGTNVQIDSMTVVTRATDAYRMASDMNDALNRKLMISNADTGQA